MNALLDTLRRTKPRDIVPMGDEAAEDDTYHGWPNVETWEAFGWLSGDDQANDRFHDIGRMTTLTLGEQGEYVRAWCESRLRIRTMLQDIHWGRIRWDRIARYYRDANADPTIEEMHAARFMDAAAFEASRYEAARPSAAAIARWTPIVGAALAEEFALEDEEALRP